MWMDFPEGDNSPKDGRRRAGAGNGSTPFLVEGAPGRE